MTTLRQSSSAAILAVAAFSSTASVSSIAQAALPAPPNVSVEQATTSSAVVDKSGEHKLALMVFIHRTGLPAAAAMPAVER